MAPGDMGIAFGFGFLVSSLFLIALLIPSYVRRSILSVKTMVFLKDVLCLMEKLNEMYKLNYPLKMSLLQVTKLALIHNYYYFTSIIPNNI